MTSHEKVYAALAQLREHADQAAGTEVSPALQGALLLFEMMAPQLPALLPADPADLDELLLTGAAWALGLRSDDAAPFALTAAAAAAQLAAETPA